MKNNSLHNRDSMKDLMIAVLLLSIILILSMLHSQTCHASLPNPQFAPLPLTDEISLAPEKLGSMPEFSEEAWRALLNGEIRTGTLPELDGSRHYECVAVINAPRQQVMAVLKDYPLRTQINSNLESIHAEWDRNMAKVSEIFNYGVKTVSVDLNYLHYQDKFIEWELVGGDFEELSGYYKLFSIENGTRTLLIQRTSIELVMHVPTFIMNRTTQKSMKSEIKEIRRVIGNW